MGNLYQRVPARALCMGRVNTTSGDVAAVTSTTRNSVLNTWTLVTLTYDGASVKTYINGVEKASAPANGAIVPLPGESSGPLNIGATAAGDFFQGYIDDVAIFSRALTPSEVSNLYSGAPATGTINVTTNVSAATFTIAGPATFAGGGASFTTDALPGSYTITYGAVAGCVKPQSETKQLTANGTVTFLGTYQACFGAGSIQVTTNLTSARYTISGPSWYRGTGKSFTQPTAPSGSYRIVYGSVDGYTTPPPKTLVLSVGGNIIFDDNYGSGCAAPILQSSPVSTTIAPGGSAELKANASGGAPMHYDWFEGTSGDTSNPRGIDSSVFHTRAALRAGKLLGSRPKLLRAGQQHRRDDYARNGHGVRRPRLGMAFPAVLPSKYSRQRGTCST